MGRTFAPRTGKAAHFDYRDAFTFAARIKPETAQGAILSIGEDYFEGKGHGLYLLDGKLRLHITFRFSDLGMRVETADAASVWNAWQHVLVTYDGGMRAAGVHMYVDGRELPAQGRCSTTPSGPSIPRSRCASAPGRTALSRRDRRAYASTIARFRLTKRPSWRESIGRSPQRRARRTARAGQAASVYLDLRSSSTPRRAPNS